MNNLLKKELQADAQAYGDERRSPLQERERSESDERARHAAV